MKPVLDLEAHDRSPLARAAVAVGHAVRRPTIGDDARRLGAYLAAEDSAMVRGTGTPVAGATVVCSQHELRLLREVGKPLEVIPDAARRVREEQGRLQPVVAELADADAERTGTQAAVSEHRDAEPQRHVHPRSRWAFRLLVLALLAAIGFFEAVVFRSSMELMLEGAVPADLLKPLSIGAAVVPALASAAVLWAIVEMRPRMATRWQSALAVALAMLPLVAVVMVATHARNRNAQVVAEMAQASSLDDATPSTPAGGLFGAATTTSTAAPLPGATDPTATGDDIDAIMRRADYTPLLLVNLLGLAALVGAHVARQRAEERDAEHRAWRHRSATVERAATTATKRHATATEEHRRIQAAIERAQADYHQAALTVRGAVDRMATAVAGDLDLVRTSYRHACARNQTTPVDLPLPAPVDREAVLTGLLEGALPGAGRGGSVAGPEGDGGDLGGAGTPVSDPMPPTPSGPAAPVHPVTPARPTGPETVDGDVERSADTPATGGGAVRWEQSLTSALDALA
ncbi:MAG: hypothetical protein AAGC46_00305 [Solirubrobacteraceae bacterium]